MLSNDIFYIKSKQFLQQIIQAIEVLFTYIFNKIFLWALHIKKIIKKED